MSELGVRKMELIQYHLTYVHFHRKRDFHPVVIIHNFQVRYASIHSHHNIVFINKNKRELLSDHKENAIFVYIQMMMYEY